jgi:hypothetical protein
VIACDVIPANRGVRLPRIHDPGRVDPELARTRFSERSYVTLDLDLVFVARLQHGKILKRHLYLWVFRVSYLRTTGGLRRKIYAEGTSSHVVDKVNVDISLLNNMPA